MLNKIIKNAILIFLICTFLLSSIVSLDAHHIETCHEEECTICFLIETAQEIINFTIDKYIYLLVGILIQLLIIKIRREENKFFDTSLVFQKVQFNE